MKEKAHFSGPLDDDRMSCTDVIAKLTSIAKSAQAQATWEDQLMWLQESRQITRKERLAAYKTVRDAGILPNEASFYIVARLIILIAEDRLMDDQAIDEIGNRIKAVRKVHGLKGDQYWPMGEGPKEYRALSAEWDRAADRVTAAAFREYGEPEMADLFENNREKFNLLYEAGKDLFSDR